jgi:hypothetical protein
LDNRISKFSSGVSREGDKKVHQQGNAQDVILYFQCRNCRMEQLILFELCVVISSGEQGGQESELEVSEQIFEDMDEL